MCTILQKGQLENRMKSVDCVTEKGGLYFFDSWEQLNDDDPLEAIWCTLCFLFQHEPAK